VNICFVCSEYPPGEHGGIGALTQSLGRALVAAGHGVKVIGVYRPSLAAPDFAMDGGVEVFRIPEEPPRFGWMQARRELYRRVREWVSAGAVDVVEVPDWQGWAALWPRLPVPLVCRLSGSSVYFAAEMGRRTSPVAAALEGMSLHRANYWCSVSRYTAEKSRKLFRLKKGPDAIIYNPVEVPSPIEFSRRSKGEVVFTGTLTAKKGIVSLVRAWLEVIRQRSDARLEVFGKDGPFEGGPSMREYLEKLLGAAMRTVSFHGHVSRSAVTAALRTARVAVFPSYAEAFALAPLESMAAGCPTIYTQRGSGPEAIDDGRDGLLIDPDSPAMIADAILRLLADDPVAEALGLAGRERVQRSFSTAVIVKSNEQFFARCVDEFEKAA